MSPSASKANAGARRRYARMVRTSMSDSTEAITASQQAVPASRIGVVPASDRSATILPARYVLLPLANALTGYTVKAMERKIERGDWEEGKVWRRAPDGHIMIDIAGYHRWVEGR